MPPHPRHYRGHRRSSFRVDDLDELVELRARQRTFDGAYSRAALGNLGFALTIFRLFDPKFFRIGIMYTILAEFLLVVSYLRHRHSRHDFADPDPSESGSSHVPNALPTVGQTGKRNFGRPFITAGWIVLCVSVIVAAIEIGLLILIQQV